MQVSPVSFGKVIAVSGKPRKINSFNNSIYRQILTGKILVQDVTEHYINAPSEGVMAHSAQSGNIIEVLITDKDVRRVRNKVLGWETTDKILSNLSGYFNLNKVSKGTVLSKLHEN